MDNEKNPQMQSESRDADISPASNRQETPERGVSRREFVGFGAASLIFAGIKYPIAPVDSKNGIPYRTLGRTGEKVSLVGLGGYHLGKQADPQESIRIIRTGLD